jgi:hypothetical protein
LSAYRDMDKSVNIMFCQCSKNRMKPSQGLMVAPLKEMSSFLNYCFTYLFLHSPIHALDPPTDLVTSNSILRKPNSQVLREQASTASLVVFQPESAPLERAFLTVSMTKR